MQAQWSSTTSSKPAVKTSTTKAETWSEWASTTTKKAEVKTTSSAAVYEWSAVPVTSCYYSTYTEYKTPDAAVPSTWAPAAPSVTKPAAYTGAAAQNIVGMGAAAVAGIAMLL